MAGIIVAAAGLEEIALHPEEAVDLAFRVMLGGGLALTVAGVAAGVWRAFHVVAKERAVAAVVLAGLLTLGSSWDGVVLLVAVDVVILVTLVVEHIRIER